MPDLENKIGQLKETFKKELEKATDQSALDSLFLKYFSKTHGEITLLLKELPKLNSDDKRKFGPLLNDLQNDLKTKIEERKANLSYEQINDPLIDLTYPERSKYSGYMHPTSKVIREINGFLKYYGFSVAEGPEIELAEYNFTRLNLPEGHPATDLQDSLFVQEPNILLRTHTSSIESRVLTDYKPPIRAAFPGKSYRNETANKTNMSFFHQYQAVVVDKEINMQHLKATIKLILEFLFGEDIKIRYRYKFYPEVSPGMGADIECKFCGGKGCSTCKFRGWVEVLGSGMIHYNTLQMCGIDPEEYTGFAFGMGLDRLVMAKYGIDDIRKLYGEGLFYE